ncbi:MAG: serine/threonine-protein kinase [Myxococcota bacterium]
MTTRDAVPRPITSDSGDSIDDPTLRPPLHVGDIVGRYVVLGQAGSGAMGRVLRAYDSKLERQVALKELTEAALDDDAWERLVLEARAMARLSHPNVVSVYDVERRAGGDVLAMEYVPGTTLAEWMREDPPWLAVVETFVAAGRGLSAAHASGLLHRDFKPSNVLVGGLHAGARPEVVKVTDFGLAKVIAAHGHAAREPTLGSSEDGAHALGGAVAGSPRYMSPEQHRGAALSSASDQYAFCVALWEAVHGCPPFLGEQLRAQKLQGPPPWPQTDLPEGLGPALRRGLAVEPEDRWPDMNALLDALTSSVEVRGSLLHWAIPTGALTLLIGGWAAFATAHEEPCSGAAERFEPVWSDARRAEVQVAMFAVDVPLAEAAWERTSAALDARADAWVEMHRDACISSTVRGEQSPAVLDRRMRCLERARRETKAAVEVLSHPDAAVLERVHLVLGSMVPVERCGDLDLLVAQVDPPRADQVEVVERLRYAIADADTLRQAGRYAQALARIERAEAQIGSVDYAPVNAELALARGAVQGRLEHHDAARVSLEAAIRDAAASGHEDVLRQAATRALYVIGYSLHQPEAGLQYRSLAEGLAEGNVEAQAVLLDNVGSVAYGDGRYDDAVSLYRQALAMAERAEPVDHLLRTQILGSLANVLGVLAKHEESETLLRERVEVVSLALGPQHPSAAQARSDLGVSLVRQGRFAEAEAELRQSLATFDAALGEGARGTGDVRSNLGVVLASQGRLREAEAVFRAELQVWLDADEGDSVALAVAHEHVGVALMQQGDSEAALPLLTQALEIRERVLGPEHPDLVFSHSNVADAYNELDRYDEAEDGFRRALAIAQKTFGSEHPSVAERLAGIGRVQFGRGDFAAALASFERAAAMFEDSLGPSNTKADVIRYQIGLAHHRLGALSEASTAVEQAWAHLSMAEVHPFERGMCAYAVAQVRWEQGEQDSARRVAAEAEQGFRAAQNEEMQAEVRAWRTSH